MSRAPPPHGHFDPYARSHAYASNYAVGPPPGPMPVPMPMGFHPHQPPPPPLPHGPPMQALHHPMNDHRFQPPAHAHASPYVAYPPAHGHPGAPMFAPTPPLPSSSSRAYAQGQGHCHGHMPYRAAPPPSYCCHKCHRPGHWIQDCPLHRRSHGTASRDDGHGPAPPSVPPSAPAPAPAPSPAPAMAPAMAPAAPVVEKQWQCEPCGKQFPIASQHEAHVKTHVQCPARDCDFEASKRVVGAHFQTAHGQYSGQGLKEIDVEGQKFMVLVGNSPEDIARWRAERRKRWPSKAVLQHKEDAAAQLRRPHGKPAIERTKQGTQAQAAQGHVPSAVKRKRSLSGEHSALEEGEVDENHDEAPAKQAKIEHATESGELDVTRAAVDASPALPLAADEDDETEEDEALPTTTAVGSDEMATEQDKEPDRSEHTAPKADSKAAKRVLCKNFLKNVCRFGARCRYSHDRSQFACRAMVSKGKCARGSRCGFSHDPTLVATQKEKQQVAKSKQLLEEKWKTEQGSLLRRLLRNEIAQEQQQLLQIIRYLVQADFLQPSAASASDDTDQGTSVEATE